ncbi:MAG: LapA family protein [Pseudomonadales bacterium]
MNLKLSVGILVVLLMVIFVSQNMEVVSVDFLVWSMEASRILIYLSIFLIGTLVGWIGKSLRP